MYDWLGRDYDEVARERKKLKDQKLGEEEKQLAKVTQGKDQIHIELEAARSKAMQDRRKMATIIQDVSAARDQLKAELGASEQQLGVVVQLDWEAGDTYKCVSNTEDE